MTDFRVLCAELTEFVARLTKHYYQPAELLTRARAALAQPEPEGPSIEDVEELCEEHCFNVEGYESIECLQGLINEAIARWGHQPAPPADGEVAECAAELLQRQALVPVSVSERLPGPEVCVPHPRTKRGNWCWGFERCEVSLARPARWRLMHMETVEMEASHWLPAHALPLPEVGNG